MAKYRHRIFEMYEDRAEAINALTPKFAKTESAPAAPLPSDFHHLTVGRFAVVTHVQFQGTAFGDEAEGELRDEFSRLADTLDINSKVLLDFADVESFSPACINALVVFDRKLRNKGSRTVLCCLSPNTRACFFAPR